jgi:MFS family permease
MAEMTIRRFGVISLAKMYGLLLFVMGLIIGVIYGLFFIIFGAAMTAIAPGGRESAAGGISTVIIGIGLMIGIPIMYGVLGFIMGAIGALIYNALAGIIGGVKFELEGVQEQDYTPPPPPHQWAPNQYPAQ